MKNVKIIATFLLLFVSFLNYSQQKSEPAKTKITGKVIEKSTNLALAYATIEFTNPKNPKAKSGAITDEKGDFSLDVVPGIYDVKIGFFSYKPIEIRQKSLLENTDLGTIKLTEDVTQLTEVVVRAEKSTVEIKLDKKVYNVGKDMIVKGGTASDVLDNVPSVTVDSDGNVSLRGNDNVKILIDGRPSNAISIADALRTISAEALDKVEVITNPSARYDAEGGAGILNIVLKKGKNQGINGTLTATVGNPKNNSLIGNINFKSEQFNLFSTIGYTDSKSFGNGLTNSDYLNPDGSINSSIRERIERERGRKGLNFNFGMDWFLTKTLTWTNAVNFRKNDGYSPETDLLYNYQPSSNFVRSRFNNQFTYTNNAEYTTNFTQKFKKDGHKLSLDGAFSRDLDNDTSTIIDFIIGDESNFTKASSNNFQNSNRNLFQVDYVLPIGKNSQFEAGYKGDYNDLLTNYNVSNLDMSGNYISDPNFTNIFQYKEKINGFYSQFGSKINKFSYLFGLRFENSDIDANLLTTSEFINKKYHDFFPSAFLTYEISDNSSASLNYSRRISRPRSRFINPFGGYTSNVNLFKGNPDINPSYTDAIDFGFMKKWNKVTLTTSLYVNQSSEVFQFVRRLNGQVVTTPVDGADVLDGNGNVILVVGGVDVRTPVYLSTPVNLDSEKRLGFEFTINYTPFKWWKINSNFNFFQSKISGDFSYTLIGSNQLVTETVNRSASSWFTKLSSKITLPYKIDWQTSATYNGPQNTAQGKSIGVFSANTAVSKDIFKDKATIALNVSDIFNSAKMKRQFDLSTLNSYSEMQRRERQINLSFTYRFNKKKTEREKPTRNENGGEDFQG